MPLAGGNVSLTQNTQYPWDGEVRIGVEPERPVEFTLRLRVPGWCRFARLQVNGSEIDVGPATDRGYNRVRRRWHAGDEITLSLNMPAERVYANPKVSADVGRVA